MISSEGGLLIGKLKEELSRVKEKNPDVDLVAIFSIVDQLEENAQTNHIRIPKELTYILEDINLGVYIKDVSFKYVYANKKFLATFGYQSVEDILGKTDYDLDFDKNIYKRFSKMYQRILEEKLPVKREISFYLKNRNKVVYIDTHKSPIFDDTNKVTGFLGIIEDVTERKFAIQALMHREARLKNYFLNTNDGIFILDYKFDIVDVNPAVFNITGYEKEFLLSKNFFSLFVDNEDLNRFRKACSSVDVNSESQECALISKNNKALKHLKLDLLNVEIDHYICFAYDISDLKRAVKKAEESNKLKTAFLQNISHEIRTPLNAIIGFSNILVQKLYDSEEDADSYKRVIYINSEYLLGLVNNVLDLSKIETGQTTLYHEDIIVIPFIKNEVLPVIESEKNRLDKLNVELKVDLRNVSSNCVVNTDAGRLKQIITNLMHNALKFTSEGEVLLKVSEHEDVLRFVVSDTGIGIHNEQIGRIFHRFYKIQADGKGLPVSSQGSGLGLAIVKRLLGLMGGNIKVESEVDAGSRFYFEVPKHL